MSDATDRFETIAVHAGAEPDLETGAVSPPIVLASTFAQDAVGRPRNGWEYGRSGNPTRAALEQCVAALGGVDILVNNAGASPGGTFDDVTDDQWYESFDLKLMGYVRCMRAVLPAMREQGYGRIVNVGGTGVLRASPGYALAALGAALVHLTRSTAELVGPDGVTVTMVHPGPTMTERLRGMLTRAAERAGTDIDAFARDVVGKALPLGRVGSPEEVAAMITILCSEQAAWITGGGLTIDGGAAQGIVGG